MTVIGFNVHRVIMALEKARLNRTTTKTLTKNNANYELLEDILEGIIIGVSDQKHYFQQYVKAAHNEGLTPKEIWSLAKEKLRDYVSIKALYNWGHELLPEEAFNPIKQMAVSHRKIASVVPVQQQIQEAISNHIECESCPEGYEIEKIRAGVYTYEYLQQVAIWLHECLELNCKGKKS